VHPAIEVSGASAPADLLPRYVPRPHDTKLREAANQVLGGGASVLVTLVGGSSTGKTRACWELVQYLEKKQPGRWWVWHPYDPTRPEAAAQTLAEVSPYTVVWLNEAQHYLLPTDVGMAERIAAGLRSLLHDPARVPVLVLATLWPQYWSRLATRPPAGEPDPWAQARDVLTGTAVTLPEAFTASDVAGLDADEADPRLRQAAALAEAGRVTQYLAGGPELENRYDTASPAARAIIQVAMDARRLGHPLALPHSLLEQAAPGYLDDHEWDALDEDWLEAALAETGKRCKGARGPLTRIRPRPGAAAPGSQPRFRLADYLEQLGSTERAAVYPPDSLWRALATTVTDPGLLRHLGEQAQHRGRYQHAIWLYTKSADRGNTFALLDLARLRDGAGDAVGAEALLRQAADRGNTFALPDLARLLERAGETAAAEALLRQAADRGDKVALLELARLLVRAGDTAEAEALLRQAADRGDNAVLLELAELREGVGDSGGAEVLLRQAADRGNTFALLDLARLRERAGDTAGAEALLRQAAARGDKAAVLAQAQMRAGDTAGADALLRAGDTAGAEVLLRRAADRGNTLALLALTRLRERAGDAAGAEALLRQAAEHGNTFALEELTRLWERTGKTADADALLREAGDHGFTFALRNRAGLLERAGDAVQADHIRRFGLTGSGEIATALDFAS
jgi:hypothetical protein